MTVKEQVTAIKNNLAAGLPALLAISGLDDFGQYIDDTPNNSTEKQIAVYPYFDNYSEDIRETGFIIKAQLAQEVNITEYHSVIIDYLIKNITQSVVGMTIREGIEAEMWPVDMYGTSTIWYLASFQTPLDDCDD